MTGKKIASIQALRGIAILLVLARHLLVMEGNYGGGRMLLPEIFKAGDGGVDLFFVISGFIMVTISRGRFRMPGAFGEFLYRRVTRIFPPYWLFSLIIFVVFLFAPGWVPAMQRGQVHLLASFLLLPSFTMPLLGQGWTLTYEVYFYLTFAVALLLPEGCLSFFLVVWGLVVAAGRYLYLNDPQLLTSAPFHLITNPITVEFILGGYVALIIQRGWRRAGWLCLAAGCLLLPMSSFYFDPLEIEGLRFFCYGLPALLILYGTVSLESRSRWRFPRWLQAIGDASFSIYLSHILVISAIGQIWKGWHRPAPWDHVLAILAMIAAALACGLATNRWIEQPLLRICHRWTPRRRPDSVSNDIGIVSP